MEYEIEKDVPMPKHHGAARYPFNEMEVGDSFVVENRTQTRAAHLYGKRHGKRFASRAVTGGFRVWRVE